MRTQKHYPLYLAVIIIILSSNQIKSKVNLGVPYIFNKTDIVLNLTESKVSEKERSQYFEWVGTRDSFYYSGRTDLLIQLITYFSPETEGYFSSLFIFGIAFFILAGLFSLFLILYLILRFGFKMFTGPKKYERSLNLNTWIIIISGISISFILLSIAMSYSNQFNSQVQDILSYEEAQIIQIQSIYDQMIFNETALKEDPYKEISIQTTISNIKAIEKNHNEQKEKLITFASNINTIQNPKFNYEISYLFFVYALGLLGIGSYFLKKGLITWTISFAIFVLTIPAIVILGLNCTYLILSIDFCQNIGKSIIQKQIPSDSTALGVYISCPSSETMKYLRIAMYEYSNSFNNIHNDLNSKLNLIGDSLPTGKRDNEGFTTLKEKYNTDKVLTSGLNSLIYTNNILAPILSQLSCQTAYSSINYIEEHFCKGAMDNLFLAIMIQMAGIIGTIILAIGLNKMIVVLNYKSSIALRGNKKYKDELYDEDLDESMNDMSFNKRRIIH